MPSSRSHHLTYTLYHGLWQGLDLIYPPVCGGCGKPGSRWCADCQANVPLLQGPLCEKCGLPQEKAGLCSDCRLEKRSFHSLRSWAIFENPIRNALHSLKYRRDMGLGDALAFHVAGFLEELNWPVDMVVPIPLGRRRLRERGYNQVGLIARPLALLLKIRYSRRALARQRETRSQVGLSREERRENVSGAFRADGSLVAGKTILVMDDVATTGSTLSSGAEALLASGAKEVYALTVARALTRHMGHA